MKARDQGEREGAINIFNVTAVIALDAAKRAAIYEYCFGHDAH